MWGNTAWATDGSFHVCCLRIEILSITMVNDLDWRMVFHSNSRRFKTTQESFSHILSSLFSRATGLWQKWIIGDLMTRLLSLPFRSEVDLVTVDATQDTSFLPRKLAPSFSFAIGTRGLALLLRTLKHSGDLTRYGVPFKAVTAMSLEIYDLCPLAGYPEKYFSYSSLLLGCTLYQIACRQKIKGMARTQAVAEVQRLESRMPLLIRGENKYLLYSLLNAATNKPLEKVTIFEIHKDLRDSVLERGLVPNCMPGIFRVRRIGRKEGEPLEVVF
jgi:hypothetical protein